MEKSLELVRQLVNDFREHEKAYLAPSYQESQVRQDFIDKFLTALGWDVSHQRQKNPYEQEVKIENKVSTQGSQRRADYAFFIVPNFREVKFYAEAKKPEKNLKNAAFYHQTIRYGWNSGTPIAVLTDFEEFHILDCRYKPDIDNALNRKLEYFHYSEYADEEKFKKIFYLFGREAVAGGSLEKYVAALPKPRGKAKQRGLFKGGYQPVDEAFLEDLDTYRETLAKAFKKENPDLGSEELTEAVQRTIDRLVFIRFLEDKQIEDPQMMNYIGSGSAWKKFSAHCRALEPKYNGLVFKKHRILDDTGFVPPDDNTFADICDELADPSSPYDFDKIPISILGSIYERFLGKVVHATAKQVRVEPKPEVRKAGGVYYTPQYIVRYIVNETVGKLLFPQPPEGLEPSGGSLTPAEVAKLKIIDIACGSGSFLIEVYSELLEYHERYYAAHPEAAKKGDLSTRDGKQVLSLKKRQEILVNNIYGVDIDFQATEVTQLSLYLKLLEDATLNDALQFSLLKEKLLPDLKNNIVCGNSLIGTDINTGQLFENKELHNLKPMNFEDAFPSVMKHGGFDAVVGNPPYVRQEGLGEQKKYFERTYKVYQGAADLYAYFIEKGIELLRPNALFGYIIPNKWMRTAYGEPLRKWIKTFHISSIIDFGDLQIFKGATTYPCILLVCKSAAQDLIRITTVENLEFSDLCEYQQKHFFELSVNGLNDSAWQLDHNRVSQVLFHMKEKSVSLEEYVGGRICRGVLSGYDNAFVIDETTRNKLTRKDKRSHEIIKPYLMGRDVGRYSPLGKGRYLIFTRHGIDIENYPAVKAHLMDYQGQLAPKPRTYKGEWKGRKSGSYRWFEIQDSVDYFRELEKPKIIYLKFQVKPAFTLDVTGFYPNSAVWAIPIDDKYLLGLLNSAIGWFLISKYCTRIQGGYQLIWEYFKQLPIRTIDFTNEVEKANHDQIVNLVEQMLKAKEELAAAKLDSDVQRLELRCATLDRQIDEAVYELYGLTEEEIKIVEGK